MINLNISSVALEQVNTDDWLDGKHPHQYQWKAYQLIQQACQQKKTLCLFLVTPTGSGKTLASYAHSIIHNKPILGVYPTNELLADQERALREVYPYSDRVKKIDSEALDRIQIEQELKRHSDTLERILKHKYILLTNPDILFYVIFGLYPPINSLRERLWTLVAKNYRFFVFDEFHLYNVKQQADTAFFIGALNAINPDVARVFIFTSATPNLEIVNLLEDKLNLWVEPIYTEPSDKPSAYTIAHPVNLTLLPSNLQAWEGLATLDKSFEIITSFHQQYPQARYVAIFDSVAGAIGAAKRFRNIFSINEVGEIHGLSSKKMRNESLPKKATVGTSTIEVGVDFKGDYEKDFLILEARRSSQFTQRFGRIARHDKQLSIPNQVLAFVPDYVYNFFLRRVQPDSHLTRQQLQDLIEEAYSKEQTFQNYLTKHASVEMLEATNLILGLFQSDDRPKIQEKIASVITSLTGESYSKAEIKRQQYQKHKILTPLLTFRGSSLEAAIIDERGDDLGFAIKRYNLMFLLRRGIFEEISQNTFTKALENIQHNESEYSYEIEREKRFSQLIDASAEELLGVYGFFRLNRLIDDSEKTRKVWFEIEKDEVKHKLGEVTVLEGLSIHTKPKAPTRLLQKSLRKKKIVAWVSDTPPNAIKLGRALPPLFALYELKVIRSGGGVSRGSWSIAFNQDAFFLNSLV